jgi:hypothetical protein
MESERGYSVTAAPLQGSEFDSTGIRITQELGQDVSEVRFSRDTEPLPDFEILLSDRGQQLIF